MYVYLLQQTEVARKWKTPPLLQNSFFLFSGWQMRIAYFSCTDCSPANSSPNYTPNEKQTASDTHNFHTQACWADTQNVIQHAGTINSWLDEVCLWGKEEETESVETPRQEPVNTPAPVACIHLPFPTGGEVLGESVVSGTQRCRTQLTRPAPSPLAPSTACWLLRTTGCPASSPSNGRLSCPEERHVRPHEVHSVSYSREETAKKTRQRRHPPSRPHRRLLQCESGEKRIGGRPEDSTVLRREAGDWRPWRGRWPARAAPRSTGGSPRDAGRAGCSWGGRRRCRADGRTYGCRCEWAGCPRSRHTGCWSMECQGGGPGWSWWLGYKEIEEIN